MFSVIFASAIESHFSDVTFRRSYTAYIVTLAVTILLWWPANHFSYFVQFNARPSTLFFAVLVLLGFALYFAIRVPARTAQKHAGAYSAEQWMKYGNATPMMLFLGTSLFSLVRTTILIATGLPFVAASLAVSGTGVTATAVALAIVACFAITIDMVVRALYAALPERPLIRFLILALVLLFFFLLNVRSAPHLNPMVALQSIVSGSGSTTLIAGEYGTIGFRNRAIGSFAISTIICTLLYAASLYLFRFRYWRKR
jgi:hypothetical protein